MMVGLVNAFVNEHLTNVEAVRLCELKVMYCGCERTSIAIQVSLWLLFPLHHSRGWKEDLDIELPNPSGDIRGVRSALHVLESISAEILTNRGSAKFPPRLTLDVFAQQYFDPESRSSREVMSPYLTRRDICRTGCQPGNYASYQERTRSKTQVASH